MTVKVEQIDAWRWRIPRQGAMHTEGLVYASRAMMDRLRQEQALEQVRNVATLPGIVGPSLAMPDIHWGYGFPIGGVAAFDADQGVVSPGGVGYDINCGVRLMRSRLTAEELRPLLPRLTEKIFQQVPSGVGSCRSDLSLTAAEQRQVLLRGARWAVERGLGSAEDLLRSQAEGCIAEADPEQLSERALERGRRQLGTLGSGNHFIEIQYVEELLDPQIAEVLGLFPGQITVAIHTGSRGLGYQVCDDALRVMLRAAKKYAIELPDRQLCCAPLSSTEGRSYLAAMACAANYAFANRQLITVAVRQAFEDTLGLGAEALQLSLIVDVCHNIATWEEHRFQGQRRRLCVHRKGATRAFAPGHPVLPACYRSIGQPVLVPGDMGRYSYVLVGTERGMEETFGSVCHGAGRVLSRHRAKKAAHRRDIFAEMARAGILLRSASRATVAEEISEAYKDVAEVVQVVEQAGIGRPVARLRPLAVIKG